MKTGNGVLKSRYTMGTQWYTMVFLSRGTTTHTTCRPTVIVRQTQKLRFVAEMHCSVSHPVSQWNPVVRSTSDIGRVAMGMGVWKEENSKSFD